MDSDYDQLQTEAEHPTQSPEHLQRKLYFLLEQLKTMHAFLPEWVPIYFYFKLKYMIKYFFRSCQMRIPYELLTALANSLVNDTIFEIVKRLMEIQHVNEKHLMQVREQVETEHRGKNKKGTNSNLSKITYLLLKQMKLPFG